MVVVGVGGGGRQGLRSGGWLDPGGVSPEGTKGLSQPPGWPTCIEKEPEPLLVLQYLP